MTKADIIVFGSTSVVTLLILYLFTLFDQGVKTGDYARCANPAYDHIYQNGTVIVKGRIASILVKDDILWYFKDDCRKIEK